MLNLQKTVGHKTAIYYNSLDVMMLVLAKPKYLPSTWFFEVLNEVEYGVFSLRAYITT